MCSIEPISNTAGIQTPTAEYFQILREICDRHDVLLIFDEVITGFGRTGRMFAAQTFGVTPDIICTGKGISSGALPMGAMLAREGMAEAFFGPAASEVNFAHGHTFAGNPLAGAVGIAVIDEIVERKLDRRAAELGRYLVGRLERLSSWAWFARFAARVCYKGSSWQRTRRPADRFRQIASWERCSSGPPWSTA